MPHGPPACRAGAAMAPFFAVGGTDQQPVIVVVPVLPIMVIVA